MLSSSMIYIILRTFPESLVAIFSGVYIIGLDVPKKELVKYGLILGTIVLMIRSLPINFGVHTVLSMMALGMILFKLTNKDILKTIVSTCSFFISLALSEGVYVFIATVILKIPMEFLTNNEDYRCALITLPSLIITIAIVFIIKKIVYLVLFKDYKRG